MAGGGVEEDWRRPPLPLKQEIAGQEVERELQLALISPRSADENERALDQPCYSYSHAHALARSSGQEQQHCQGKAHQQSTSRRAATASTLFRAVGAGVHRRQLHLGPGTSILAPRKKRHAIKKAVVWSRYWCVLPPSRADGAALISSLHVGVRGPGRLVQHGVEKGAAQLGYCVKEKVTLPGKNDPKAKPSGLGP